MPFNFTRVQLIILILILILAASTVTFAFVNAASQALDQQVLLDVTVIREALRLDFEENGFYPNSSNGIPNGIETYLNFYPTAVLKGSCQDSAYTYTQKLSGTDYNLNFCLGHDYNNFRAGNHTANSKAIQ